MDRDTATAPNPALHQDDLVDTAPLEDLEDLALDDDYALNPDYVAMVVDAADRGDSAAPARPDRRPAAGRRRRPDGLSVGATTARKSSPSCRPTRWPTCCPNSTTTSARTCSRPSRPNAWPTRSSELESDDAADLVDDLEDDKRDAVLAAMSDVDRAAIESTLAYEEETAGRLMQREVLAAPQFWTVGQTIDHIRSAADDLPDLFFDVYVVDPAYKPVGAVPVSRLLKARARGQLADIMEPVTEIPVDLDQEEVAYIFDKYHLISAPVIDEGGRLVGQITVDDIVGVIQEESEEDILALAGVSDAGRDADRLRRSSARACRGCWSTRCTATLAASVIGMFQDEIAKLVTLAVLMPIVASLGGNAGTQTLAVAVRALATRELNCVQRHAHRRPRTVRRPDQRLRPRPGAGGRDLVRVPRRPAQPDHCAGAGGQHVRRRLGRHPGPVGAGEAGPRPGGVVLGFRHLLTDFIGFFVFLGLAALILL